MGDQTIQTGGLALGLPAAVVAAVAPRPAPAGARSGRPAEVPAADPPADGGPEGSSPVAALAQLNGHLRSAGTELRVQVDDATGTTFFRIVKENTGEVLLQVPSAELLAMARNLRALDKQKGGAGVLLDREG